MRVLILTTITHLWLHSHSYSLYNFRSFGKESCKISTKICLTSEELQPFITSSNAIPDLQNVAIISAALSYFLYDQRPRGSCRDDLIEIRKSSQVPDNLGVIANTFIPKDTVLGIYPGYVRKLTTTLESKNDEAAQRRAAKYFWKVDKEFVLDPTNFDGVPKLEIVYLFGILKVSTTLSRMNEPPIGKDCNVYPRNVERAVVEIVTERDIFPGEEIFVDYGKEYDRTDYTKVFNPTLSNDTFVEEDIKYLPIIDTTDSQEVSSSSKVDNNDILSPDNAAKKFVEEGVAMFADQEDKELLEGMLGKTKLKKIMKNEKKKDGSNGSIESVFVQRDAAMKNKNDQKIDENDGEDDIDYGEIELLIEKVQGATDSPDFSESADIFGRVYGKEAEHLQRVSTIPMNNNQEVVKKSTEQVVNDRSEEVKELLNQLENMSDEQVKEAFREIKKNLQNEMKKKIELEKIKKGKQKLPDIPSVDPSIRQKYSKEFEEVQKELEKLYEDPLKVWQDILKNPELFLEDLDGL